MPKPQTIGSHTFATKGAAEEFIKAILHRHPLKAPITGEDHEFLIDLLKKHERAAEKIGAGVKHFTVENAKGGTQCSPHHHGSVVLVRTSQLESA